MREGLTPLRVKSWLHPPLYKGDLASPPPPPFLRGRSTLVWTKKKCLIKSSVTAGSVTPSHKEEDIYYCWSLLRPVHVPPFLPPHSSSLVGRHHAVAHDTAEEEMLEPEEPVEDGRPSSAHLLRLRRRAFMKKLLTVESSRPSC